MNIVSNILFVCYRNMEGRLEFVRGKGVKCWVEERDGLSTVLL